MTVREMLGLIPPDERASGWITVTDPTGRFFYGHRDDIPESVAELPVGRLKAVYVWEADRFVITLHTWRTMSRMGTSEFEPGELFIYRKAPGVYELGVVKRDRGDGTYACYYSTGDTAAVTPAHLMRKLVNAKWAPIQWAVGVPEAFMGCQVVSVTATDGCLDIEVTDA